MEALREAGVKRTAAIAAVLLLALAFVLPSAASAVIPSGNLIANRGAEEGPSGEVGNRLPIPGWSTAAGAAGFMAIEYRPDGDPAPRLHVSDPNTSGCRAFFGGGEGVSTMTAATQTIDVSAAAAEIDTGSVSARTSALIGQVSAPGEGDLGEVRHEFLGAAENVIGSASMANAGTVDQLQLAEQAVAVPVGTRRIRVSLIAQASGSSNLVYFDDVGLTLDGSSPNTAPLEGCQEPPPTGTVTPPATASPQAAAAPPTRAISIAYSAKREVFRGRVRSSAAACLRGRVLIFRKRKGPDPKVAAASALVTGKWKAPKSAKAGSYYAKLRPARLGGMSCPAAKSLSLKVG